MNPAIVVTLGATAMEALKVIDPHGVVLSRDVRTIKHWFGRNLIPLYHPGARAMVHRSKANQRSDYQFVAEQLRRHSLSVQSRVHSKSRADVANIAREILSKRSATSYFALHKLFYLVECAASEQLGHRLTRAYFIRQKDGPYCTDLHLAKLRKAITDLVVENVESTLLLRLSPRSIFQDEASKLSDAERALIEEVVAATASLSDAELKTKTYLTKPMRSLLRTERTQLLNLYNSPLFAQTSIETPADDGQVELA